jgi:hypothetical protein
MRLNTWRDDRTSSHDNISLGFSNLKKAWRCAVNAFAIQEMVVKVLELARGELPRSLGQIFSSPTSKRIVHRLRPMG